MRRFKGLLFFLIQVPCFALPSDFVYLHDTAPDIIEDLRYADSHNFTGKVVPGYLSGRCILTRQAANHLAKIEAQAKHLGYTLKVYDCYRPTKAVKAFYNWSQNIKEDSEKPYYYPRVEKSELFEKGYIALSSGHSRGSTVDLTLVSLSSRNKRTSRPDTACFGKSRNYQDDNSINTGTRFDCLDPSAHVFYKELSAEQKKNRLLLRTLMIKGGFKPYAKEWWHFTLKDEPFPKTYFNFSVK
ncbi:M15 family metallopeptidase [Legionella quinlivanii]|uniref:M15 family metallopeptidase n=1 Tax=Legionella quinlivanii TaxID=45073 RepID=UPI002244C569|nr:M15 family metallopeptidase [Legionella quinlivanii]MCW8449744.1 M15 family metallopeptidase [Legionella quinlivanii]